MDWQRIKECVPTIDTELLKIVKAGQSRIKLIDAPFTSLDYT